MSHPDFLGMTHFYKYPESVGCLISDDARLLRVHARARAL